MKALVPILIIVCAIASSRAAEPYDIKGDRLGMTIEEFKKAHYSFHNGDTKKHVPNRIGPYCTDTSDVLLYLTYEEAQAGVTACYGGDDIIQEIVLRRWAPPTIANVPLRGFAFHFYQGKLFKIMAAFDVPDYEKMRDSFISKFGVPVVVPHKLQNSYGAKFDAEECDWSNGVSQIAMFHRIDADLGSVTVLLPDIERQVQAAAPKKPKDL